MEYWYSLRVNDLEIKLPFKYLQYNYSLSRSPESYAVNREPEKAHHSILLNPKEQEHRKLPFNMKVLKVGGSLPKNMVLE